MANNEHNGSREHFFRSRGLRLKLLLSFMLLIFITTSIMFGLTYTSTRSLAGDKVHHRIILLASLFSKDIESEINSCRSSAERLASAPFMKKLKPDSKLPAEYESSYLHDAGAEAAFILLMSGNDFVPLKSEEGKPGRDLLMKQPEVMTAARQKKTVIFTARAIANGRESIFFATPIPDEHGNARGVLIVEKKLNTIQFGQIIQEVEVVGGVGLEAYLVDRHGTVLANPDARKVGRSISAKGMPLEGSGREKFAMLEKRGPSEEEATFYVGNTKYIGAAMEVSEELGWKALIIQPYDEVFATVSRVSMRILIVGGLALIVAFGLALYRAHRIIDPIGDLLTAVDEIAAGDYSKRVKVHRMDEMGSLAMAFNRMSSTLEEKISALQQSQEQLREALHQLQIDAHRREHRLRELTSISEVTQAISNSLDLQTVLNTIVSTINNVMGFRHCSIKLLDKKTNSLPIAVSTGLSELYVDRPPTRVGKGISGQAVKSQSAIIVEDIDNDSRVPKDHILHQLGIRSMCCIPLITKQSSVLGALNIYTEKAHVFTDDEMRLLSILSNQASSAIENARLFNDLRENYFNTIEALSMTIDAKDTYTHGHSKRVSEFSVMIGRQMNLPPEDLERLKHAGDLHDIGKIGISELIIAKEGKLTIDEYEIIKTHPLVGETIIEPVPFLKEVKKIIRNHHERHDGYGYPDGLRGDEIPLMARILHLADAYDAMTSDRPYRKALSHEMAVKEIVKHAGTQFDPDTVTAFMSIDFDSSQPAPDGKEA